MHRTAVRRRGGGEERQPDCTGAARHRTLGAEPERRRSGRSLEREHRSGRCRYADTLQRGGTGEGRHYRARRRPGLGRDHERGYHRRHPGHPGRCIHYDEQRGFRLAIAPEINATIVAGTSGGRIAATDLPLALRQSSETNLAGTLGSGGATNTVLTSNGDIVLSALR